ncbi:8-oxoguanine DNA glycosylase [Bombus vancouverensis nearcticus]|uniref:8-oxoguanine DNA glycosylase n=1 Tax=Bombus vancouverensis nearcticus TaxID=2705178 RepID=UPI00143C4BE1|nr:N-glycosylase/DNA lyase [Bombus vancouverensis nearcticus]
MHENEVRTKHGKIACLSSELDLGITLKGGQSFRWFNYNNGYRGVFGGYVWTLTQHDNYLFYNVQGPLVDSKNYDTILSDYFRLNECLKDLCEKWTAADPHFKESLNKTNGVRILNQDVVENVFSFICSSNNNIQRISGMVEKLCMFFGEKICSIEGKDYYKFPSIEALASKDVESKLREEKFGYRAEYIVNTAMHLIDLGGKQWLSNLHKKNNTSYAKAREQLIILPGIGPKVADCVCLMSLGHLEAIPVDTHIFQIARARYLPHLKQYKTVTPKIHEEISNYLRELWGPLAGWAQALVFCAKINDISARTGSRSKRKNSTSSMLRNLKKF